MGPVSLLMRLSSWAFAQPDTDVQGTHPRVVDQEDPKDLFALFPSG